MAVSTFNRSLTTIQFYVLLAVADRPLHGYGIRDQIALDSDSAVVVATGTLYPTLTSLVKSGLLEAIESPDEKGQSIRRYRLTPNGQHRLQAEAKRFQHAATHARYKLGGRLPA